MPQLIEVPGYGEVEFPDDMSDDQIVSAIQGLSTPQRTTGQEVRRQAGLTMRPVVEAAAAIPLAAADFGVGARNLITGGNYESPSSMFKTGMDKLYGARETPLEEVVGIASSGIAGSKLPVPNVNGAAPAGYQNVAQMRAAATADKVRKAQQAGYVVPPTTSNPTSVNKVLEGLAGKLNTAQHASLKNVSTTERLASRGLGMSEDVPLTMESIDALRQEAGQAYEAISKLGKFDATGVNLPKDVAVEHGMSPLLAGKTKSVDSAELLRAWKQANADSTAYFRAYIRDANPETQAKAKAAKSAAEQIHKFMMQKVAEIDPKMAAALKPARQLIAKTYTIEGAMRKADQVSPAKLAGDLAKQKPLTGEIRQIAEFGRDFPKAARTLNESFPGMSPLDAYAAMGTAGISKNPAYLGMPFLRLAARNALFTPLGQKLAVPSQGGPIAPEIAAALAQGSALFRQ